VTVDFLRKPSCSILTRFGVLIVTHCANVWGYMVFA
jgi:hypothetical protein